jgi:hypothetical protein
VFVQAEIVGIQNPRYLDVGGLLDHDGAEDETFGIQVDRKSLLEGNVRGCHRGLLYLTRFSATCKLDFIALSNVEVRV